MYVFRNHRGFSTVRDFDPRTHQIMCFDFRKSPERIIVYTRFKLEAETGSLLVTKENASSEIKYVIDDIPMLRGSRLS